MASSAQWLSAPEQLLFTWKDGSEVQVYIWLQEKHRKWGVEAVKDAVKQRKMRDNRGSEKPTIKHPLRDPEKDFLHCLHFYK